MQEILLLLLLLLPPATAQKHGHTALPDGETPWPWRTNKSENPTQKLSNVTSETLETEQQTCKKLAAAAATTQKHSHTALLDGETPWPWRTNESENPTQKLSNVTSETLETEQKTCEKLTAAAAAATAQKHGHTALPDGKTPWPGRTNESENPTQKLSNVTSKTLETEQKARTAAAAAAATAAADKATAAAGLQNVPLATPKHHATEGRNDFQKKRCPGAWRPLWILLKTKQLRRESYLKTL